MSDQTQGRLSIDALGPDVMRDSALHLNVRQEFIVTTQDRVLLCLNENLANMGRKNSWQAPASTFLALLAALVSAEFTEARLGLQPAVWEAMFLLGSLITAVWLLFSLRYVRLDTSPQSVVSALKPTREAPLGAARSIIDLLTDGTLTFKTGPPIPLTEDSGDEDDDA